MLNFIPCPAGMTKDDIRAATIIQPSLLQYGVNTTLRPKLDFFLKELMISESDIGRIVKSAPAVMGLSLTENLRPKVASMMKLCALDPCEVGYIITISPQILLLSQKSKIEPTLKFLYMILRLREPRELGELMLKVPRVLHQGLETSLAKKMVMLTNNKNTQKSRDTSVTIIRKNPSLLVTSNAVLDDRIERCPKDVDIATWLLPSTKGRRGNPTPRFETNLGRYTILASPNPSFDSLTRIYSSIMNAAQEIGIAESVIREACENRRSIDGDYLCPLSDAPLSSEDPNAEDMESHTKTVPISIFCSGGIYPSDNADVARGQSTTGGLAIQVFVDGSNLDKARFFQEFSDAANSCFGIRLPAGKDDDGSKVIAVFPLVNPSRNRCDLFACSGALKILEAFLKTKRNKQDTSFYDVKVYTDSNYAWKLVKSKDQLLELGSYFRSQDMLKHLDNVASYTVNVDIFHPVTRCFRRLNGCAEPLESTHRTFDGIAKVEFLHSMDGVTPNNGGLKYVKRLKRQAKSAAMWQFKRERSIVW